ncbi:PREDICTED: F-box/LRR-repeat protein At4g14103-like [Nelumbo nucifera]|uniref:F-box/LRR-repeat protein At4g14103-like n=1 Tax=Nelumbo nucifera TaxID=4432 RepID=A0A1U7Z5N0_NELNU|nr:PREDICTED: F-box/LRR-repeat protein At4g14103-like [Nelumbo nucifera]
MERLRRNELGMDRISSLPDSVLVHILSFLPTHEAVKTTFISKKWKFLWTQIPVLDLDEFTFCDERSMVELYNALETGRYFLSSMRLDRQRKRFADFVDRALLHHDIESIRQIQLSFCYHEDYEFTSRVDQWIRFAIASNATALELNFASRSPSRDPRIEGCYELPHCPLPQSLKFLRLNFCEFRPLRHGSFDHLEIVELLQAKLPDGSVQDLISNCPCLESLHLLSCCVPHHLVISAPESELKCLLLDSCSSYEMNGIVYKYEIDAPKLQHFKFVGMMLHEFSVKRLRHLVEAHLDVRQLKPILVNYVLSFKDEIHVNHEIALSSLHRLNNLTVQTRLDSFDLLGLACLLRSSPNLEFLTIDIDNHKDLNLEYLDHPMLPNARHFDEMSFWENQSSPFQCLAKLEKVTINDFSGQDNEMGLVKFLLKNCLVLKEMSIRYVIFQPVSTISGRGIDREHLEFLQAQLDITQELLTFPRVSTCAQVFCS